MHRDNDTSATTALLPAQDAPVGSRCGLRASSNDSGRRVIISIEENILYIIQNKNMVCLKIPNQRQKSTLLCLHRCLDDTLEFVESSVNLLHFRTDVKRLRLE